MPIFTDGPRMQPEQGPDVDALGVSTLDMLGATADSAVHEFPSLRVLNIRELNRASSLDEDLSSQISRIQAGEDINDVVGHPRPPTDLVPIAEARQRVKDAGLGKALSLPNQPEIRQAALDIMIERARERRERDATIARGPDSYVASALGVGTSFLVGALDPLNVASAFIPVVGELRYAKLLADAGESAISRAGVRAGVGAAEGAVGQAALEPIQAAATLQEGQDYTMAQALRSVVFGAALGSGLRSGGGAIADVVRRRGERPLYPHDLGDPLEYHTPFSEVALPRPGPLLPGEALPDLPERYPGFEPAPFERAAASPDTLTVAAPAISDRHAVHEDVASQLTRAGMPEDEAHANAAVVAARYATRAERLGEPSALELYRSEGISVRGPDAGIADEPGLTLDQRRKAAGPDLFQQREADGQTSLPGTERIGQGEQAQRAADQPLKPKAAQKPLDVGLFGDDSKQKSFFQSGRAPTFYSAVERVVTGAKQEKASAGQWLATIKNSTGVKAEELEWLGIEPWLKAQKGTVTKQQIADYVRANNLEVKEVERGGGRSARLRALDDEIRPMSMWPAEPLTARDPAQQHRLDELLHEWDKENVKSLAPTGFQKYMTPSGGENAREIVLTLPHTARDNVRPSDTASAKHMPRWNEINQEIDAKREALLNEPRGDRPYWRQEVEQSINHLAMERESLHRQMVDDTIAESRGHLGGEPYVVPSGHKYGDTASDVNRIAHIFTDDRMIDGKKTLLIREGQSDWHQAGQAKGYTKEIEAATDGDLVDGKRVDTAENLEQVPFPHEGGDKWEFTNRLTGEKEVGWGKTEVEARAHALKWVNGEMRRAAAYTGVPDAPFKTTWPDLIMKRMIRYAAEHGYEKLAWVTGETAADRYDLSKQVQAVSWNEKTGDFQAKDHSGQVVIRRKASAEELPDILGKEVAGKLLAQEAIRQNMLPPIKRENLTVTQSEHQYHVRNQDGREVSVGKGVVDNEAEAIDYGFRYLTKRMEEISENKLRAGDSPTRSLEGLDLKVGGKFVRDLYDKRFPEAANKLAKKYGAKVDQGEVAETGRLTVRYEGQEPTQAQIAAVERAANAPPRERVFESPITGQRQESQINRVANAEAVRLVRERMQSEGLSFPEAMAIDGDAHLAEIFGGSMEQAREPAVVKVHTLTITDDLRKAAIEHGFPLFQGGVEGAPQGRITLAENKAIVDLFKTADRSTFMHEMGHKFLDELARDAARANVPQALKDDLGSVLRWLGVTKAEDIGRPQHEQWARGWEQYLATGQAPSTALAAAFSKFKDWLTAIYRGLVGSDHPINADIRAVMDRLIATDREIAERPSPASAALDDLPPRAKEDAMRAATAALISGEPVRVGEMLEAAAKDDPRIAESMAAADDLDGIVSKNVSMKRRGPRARDPETWSLLEFIASRGGIDPNDPLIGDVRGLTGGVRKFIPGFGDIVRKNGLRLDAMREAAVEAGYLFDIGHVTDAQATTTVRTLLDAMDTELRGNRIYRHGYEPELSKADLAHRLEAEMAHFESQAHYGLEEAGIDSNTLPNNTMARVVEIMRREGETDALAAYERAVMEETHYGADAGQHQRIADDIPGWDAVPDDAGSAPAPGGTPAAGGERDAGAAARQSGGSDRSTAYRELAERSADPLNDPEAVAASRAADKLPAPASADSAGRLAAAEKAAAEAEQAFKDAEPYLPDDLRQRVADELDQHRQDVEAQAEVIKRGGACLSNAKD